jgi:hypothetical protein
MVKFIVKYIVILILVLGLPSISGAYGEEGPTGLILNLPLQLKEQSMRDCIPSHRYDTWAGKLISMNCEVSSFKKIDTYNGIAYFSASYNRVTVRERDLTKYDEDYQPGAKEQYDIKGKEIAILEQHGNQLKPIWYNTEDGDEARFFDDDVVMLTTVRSKPVFEMIYSTHGTAGSWQEFIILEGNKWKYLDIKSFERQIRVPKGYEIRDIIDIDIHNLTALVGIHKPTEGDCCPSKQIAMKLDLVGTKLVLKSMKIKRIRD